MQLDIICADIFDVVGTDDSPPGLIDDQFTTQTDQHPGHRAHSIKVLDQPPSGTSNDNRFSTVRRVCNSSSQPLVKLFEQGLDTGY